MNTTSSDTLNRLRNIRATIRRRLGIHGVCAVLSGGCLSFLFVVTVDWLLELPPLVRVIGAALFILGCGLATLHWIIRPLQVPWTLSQLAGRLERHFGGLDDRLSSTVGFLTEQARLESSPTRPTQTLPEQSRQSTSAALMTQVIANTERVVADLPLEDVLTLRPLLRPAILLFVGLSVLATLSFSAGEWITIGLKRYVQPFSEIYWPHRVEIVPETQNLKVPIGESATVRMRIARGMHPDLRGVVHLVSESGNETRLAMHREGTHGYRCTIDGVSGDLSYWFEAGDDSTKRHPSQITAIRRIGVSSIFARIEPPSYATSAEIVEYDLSAGPASAVPRSLTHIRLTTTKPVARRSDDSADAWLELLQEGSPQHADADATSTVVNRAPLSFATSDGRQLTSSFIVNVDVKFIVHLADRDGFTGRRGTPYRVLTRPDDKPRVELIEPRALTEVTPDGSLMIRAGVRDDLGLTNIALVGQVDGVEETFSLPLLPDAVVTPSPSGVSADIDYLWEVAPLKLDAPASLVYRIEATDNCPYHISGGQIGVSRTMRLKVISPAELGIRMREEFALLRKRLRQTLLVQQAITDDTEELSESDGSSSRTMDRAAPLAGREDAAARQLEDLAARYQRLARRVERNGIQSGASVELLNEASDELSSVATGPMVDMTRELEQASEARSTTEARTALDRAAERGHTSARRLRDWIQQMDQWGDFQDVVNKTRDLSDRQQRLRADTRAMGRRTLGKRADELTRSQRSDLRRLKRRQTQLAEELDALLVQLREAVKSQSVEDPAGAATMRAALRAAAAAEVSDRMKRAAEAVEANRLAGAGVEQRLASQGLSRMLSGLEEREVRRLAELVKRLDQADVAAAELLADQVARSAATSEAVNANAAKNVLVEQAADQSRLARNATGLAGELSESDDTADAARSIRHASREMRRAASSLSNAQGSSAVQNQTAAEDHLRDALTELQERARLAAHAASQRMLAAVRARLEDIRSQQVGINNAATEVLEVIQSRGGLNRTAARKAARLANTQREATVATESVRERVARTVVYARVVTRIVEGMSTSGAALEQRRIDESLVETQAEVVRRLDQLIRALRDAAELPPTDEFADATGGGGGGSESDQSIAIPTAAELLMLRTMQVELLTDTLNLESERAAENRDSELNLREAARIGHRQREVRELTEEVIANVGARNQQ